MLGTCLPSRADQDARFSWLALHLGEPGLLGSLDLSRGLATPWDGISGPFLLPALLPRSPDLCNSTFLKGSSGYPSGLIEGHS